MEPHQNELQAPPPMPATLQESSLLRKDISDLQVSGSGVVDEKEISLEMNEESVEQPLVETEAISDK